MLNFAPHSTERT